MRHISKVIKLSLSASTGIPYRLYDPYTKRLNQTYRGSSCGSGGSRAAREKGCAPYHGVATLGLSAAVCSITCKVLSFVVGPYYTGSRSLFYARANLHMEANETYALNPRSTEGTALFYSKICGSTLRLRSVM